MDMQVAEIAQGVVRVTLVGRLDIQGAAKIDMGFSAVAGSNRGIVVDMSEVTFLASIGIRTLVLGAKTMQRRGGTLVLLRPVADVEKVLEMTGITDLLPILHDEAAAIAAVTG
jgi:anti-sigma B factor antagonist